MFERYIIHIFNRALTVDCQREHHWLRILDVPVALSARTYAPSPDLYFVVTDAQGFTNGSYLLSGGVATAVSSIPDAALGLSLRINELSSIYLGGMTALSFLAAGRLTELAPGSAVAVDAAFHSPVSPWLTIWY